MSEISRALGSDIGTMFYQTAEKQADGNVKTQIVRNAFVEMAAGEDTEEMLTRNGWNFIKDDDPKSGLKYYITGEDAMKVAKMFPGKVQLRRPLEGGVLNKGEDKKLLVLGKIIESTVGNAPDNKSVITTCVSSESVDESQDSTFHRRRLEALFSSKGWNVKIIEEAHAVVLSERPTIIESDGTEAAYSGIGISFGAGRVNCVLSYKGVQIVGMSASRSGDWLDEKVAEATGIDKSLCTSYKENKLNLLDPDLDSEIAMAYDAYHDQMFKYVFSLFGKKFQEVKSEFDAPIDVVVAGGTSMPKGFVDKLKKVVNGMKLPFKIKDVRHAKDPRNAVVYGCLAHAIASQKKLEKESA
jgi:hypothetical protein